MTTRALPFVLVPPSAPVVWRESHKGSAALLRLADRHYTRQTLGSNQCCRPGHNLVLVATDGNAAWVVWRPNPDVGRMDLLEAWECTFFRNESSRLSSDLIREATEITCREWGWPPRDGLITAVGIEETRRRRSRRSPPGRCFLEAGWVPMPEKTDAQKAWFRAPHPMRTAKNKEAA